MDRPIDLTDQVPGCCLPYNHIFGCWKPFQCIIKRLCYWPGELYAVMHVKYRYENGIKIEYRYNPCTQSGVIYRCNDDGTKDELGYYRFN